MSDGTRTNWTEIGVMWPGKNSVAQGTCTVACDCVLKAGDSIVIQNIDYKEKPKEGAPAYKLSVVKEITIERKAEQKSGGF